MNARPQGEELLQSIVPADEEMEESSTGCGCGCGGCDE